MTMPCHNVKIFGHTYMNNLEVASMEYLEGRGGNCGGPETVRTQCVQPSSNKEESLRGACDAGAEGAWKERWP